MTELPLEDRPHTLYRFFDLNEVLLYIGITANAATRWIHHAWNKDWWPRVAGCKIEHYPNRALARAAEESAIKTERPLFNVQHNRKQTERQPAWAAMRRQTAALPDDLPPQHTVALIEDDGQPLSVALRWQIIDGEPVCVGMAMGSAVLPHMDFPQAEGLPEIGAPLTAGTFRRFQLREHIAEQRVALMGQLAGQVIVRESAVRVRVKTAERLEEAARVYREAFARGDKPTKAVAEHFGLSTGGGSNLVARARAAGLLPPTSPGAPHADTPPDNGGIPHSHLAN